MIPLIACYRETTLLTDALVQAWMAAEQIAISRDFAQHWGDAQLVFIPPGKAIPPEAWQCVFFDHSDQADALGYHTLTQANLPILKIFVKDALADGENWNVTADHEVKETIADPFINQSVAAIEDGVAWEYGLEVCDACEDDRWAYPVNGHMMSAFCTPAFFGRGGTALTFPLVPQITVPFELADGGYLPRRQISPVPGSWTQLMARVPGSRMVKRPTSRTLRRFAA